MSTDEQPNIPSCVRAPSSAQPGAAWTTWPLLSPHVLGLLLGGLWESSLCFTACISVAMGCCVDAVVFSLGSEDFHGMTGTGSPLPWMEGRMMPSWPGDGGSPGQRRVPGFLPYCESLWYHRKRTSHGERHADERGYQVKGALPSSLMASICCVLIRESFWLEDPSSTTIT